MRTVFKPCYNAFDGLQILSGDQSLARIYQDTYLYFVELKRGKRRYIKIGMTRALELRLSTLTRKDGDETNLLGYFKVNNRDAREIEAALHFIFDYNRELVEFGNEKEWFRDSRVIRSFIKDHCYGKKLVLKRNSRWSKMAKKFLNGVDYKVPSAKSLSKQFKRVSIWIPKSRDDSLDNVLESRGWFRVAQTKS